MNIKETKQKASKPGRQAGRRQAVTYVRLSDYYIKYIETRYGSPAKFPLTSALSLHVERYLVANPLLKPLTPFAMSEAAFNQQRSKALTTRFFPNLTEEQRREFISIQMPAEVIRPSGARLTTEVWQLSAIGAKLLRKAVKRDFWLTLSDFAAECRYRSERMGERLSMEAVVNDFLLQYDIGPEHSDNIMRSWYRSRRLMDAEIEDNRERMEQMTGKAFIYT